MKTTIPIVQILKDEYILNKLINIYKIDNDSFIYSYAEKNYDFFTYSDKEGLNVNTTHRYLFLNNEQILLDLKKNSLDYETEVTNKLIDIIKSNIILFIYNQFKNIMLNLAEKSYQKSLTTWDKFKLYLYKIFNKRYKKTIKIKNAEDLVKIIMTISGSIIKNTREGGASFIICNFDTGALIKQHINFKHYFSEPKILNPFLLNIGQIYGIDVFIDLGIHNNNMVVYVGRKSNNFTPGIQYFCKNIEANKIEDPNNIHTMQFILKLESLIKEIGKNVEHNYEKFYYKLV